jgi:uncharacterized membrane protein
MSNNINNKNSGQKTRTDTFFTVGTDLLLLVVVAFLTLALVIVPFPSGTLFRAVVASLFIFFVPGYAFAAALYTKKDDISTISRFILSFVFSAIISPAIGLILNFTPWGITLASITIGLNLVIWVCIAIAFQRRSVLPLDERFSLNVANAQRIKEIVFPPSESRFAKSLTSVLIIAMLISTIGVTYAITKPANGEHFTEFYILGPQGKAEDYPTQYYLGEQQSVVVGIANREQHEQAYDLVVTLNGTKVTTLYSTQITLANNQVWEEAINLKPDQTGSHMEMEFLLYLDHDHSSPYRTTHLWVNVT